MIACQLVYNIYSSFFSFNLVSECRRPQYKANKGDSTVMAAVASKGTVFTPKGFSKIEITIQNITTTKVTSVIVNDTDFSPAVFLIHILLLL